MEVFSLEFLGIVSHGTESFEDDLGWWIENHDQLRVIITSKFTKHGIFLKLRISERIRPRVKYWATLFHIVNGNDQVLSLKIGQKA